MVGSESTIFVEDTIVGDADRALIRSRFLADLLRRALCEGIGGGGFEIARYAGLKSVVLYGDESLDGDP